MSFFKIVDVRSTDKKAARRKGRICEIGYLKQGDPCILKFYEDANGKSLRGKSLNIPKLLDAFVTRDLQNHVLRVELVTPNSIYELKACGIPKSLIVGKFMEEAVL